MILKFVSEDHTYESDDEAKWLSVTRLVSQFKKPFDADTIAVKSSKNKKSKWYGMTPDNIKKAWKDESTRATTLGSLYHAQREQDICEISTLEEDGIKLPIYTPVEKEGIKYAPIQKLENGVYPEHLMYLRSASICGQADIVKVVNGQVNILDYKTNKEIKTQAYQDWKGKKDMMAAPISHIEDCNYNHYSLQLSMYMYIILRHNPSLRPGNLRLHHILFEVDGTDKFGNPITSTHPDGSPVVKGVVPYEVPYLKEECVSIIHWLEANKDKVKKFL